jgi:hypothetical protein
MILSWNSLPYILTGGYGLGSGTDWYESVILVLQLNAECIYYLLWQKYKNTFKNNKKILNKWLTGQGLLTWAQFSYSIMLNVGTLVYGNLKIQFEVLDILKN